MGENEVSGSGRTAVVRVMIEASDSSRGRTYADGLAALAARGIQVVAAPVERLVDGGWEIQLILHEPSPETVDASVAECELAFERSVQPGVMTFISRGTDADAAGVLASFGVRGTVRRVGGDEEIVVVDLAPGEQHKIVESSLRTALEAALNCEVRVAIQG